MKKIFGLLLAITLIYGVFFTQIETTELVICADGQGEMYTPQLLCRSYLKQFRTNSQGIDDIKAANGLNFILKSTSPERFDIADQFIDAGLDINFGPSTTPLCTAITLKEYENMRYLLEKGAVVQHSSCDAFALAEHLQDEKAYGLLKSN
jgi:hypothetical protein